MKNLLSCLLLAYVVGLSSCKIQEEINFKKDLSGSFSYSVDMSMMRMMSSQLKNMSPEQKGDDSIPSLSPPKDMFGALDSLDKGELTQRIASIQGLSNVVSSMDNGSIRISFDFKDLTSLNKAYNLINSGNNFLMNGKMGGFKPGDVPDENSKPEETPNHAYFVQKGSYITFTRPEAKNMPKNNPMDASMAQMSEAMFEYKSKINFDKKVKSLKAKNINAIQEDNTIRINGSMQDLMKGGAELKIKLK
jgi:acylphosphatase